MGIAHRSKIPSGDMMKETIVNNINSKKDMIILGYGQSGSGKTSTLIRYLNTTPGQEKDIPGFLPTVLNNLNATEYRKLELTYINMYMNWDTINSSSEITRNHYKLSKIGDGVVEFVREPVQNNWVNRNKISLGRSILLAFENREIEPTENNPNSSRSHVLIHIKVFNSRNDVQCNIVVGDLAGVENRFTCSPSSIINLDEIYRTKSDRYKISSTNDVEIYFDLLVTSDTTNKQQLEIFKNKEEKKMDTITQQRVKSILTCINVIDEFEKVYNNNTATARVDTSTTVTFGSSLYSYFGFGANCDDKEDTNINYTNKNTEMRQFHDLEVNTIKEEELKEIEEKKLWCVL